MTLDLGLCRVVLVQTHFPGNLGAAARVMANLGLCDLVLVDPVADPRDRNAREMSTHGEPLLDAARVVPTFDDAVADCVLVAGTSARAGGPFRRQSVGMPDVVLPRLLDVMREGHPVALVFGPEPSGLENAVVTRCHYLITIPTDEAYPALNLAQAVAICLYELRRAWLRASEMQTAAEPSLLADYKMQQRMFAHLQEALEKVHFLYGEKAEPLMHALRHLFGRAKLTPMEVRMLHGLARQLCWFAGQCPEAGNTQMPEPND